MPAGLRPSPPDHFSAYKERHANGALKIRLATMASHKARDGLCSILCSGAFKVDRSVV